MSITLEMRPTDPPMGWDEFRAKTPKFSIALDGFVSTGPRFDGSGPWLNLNHHEDVDRLATRATCGQVLMALRQGLFTCFRDASGPRATVWVNDCDEDVCLSWFLLKHGHLAEHAMNPALNRLVSLEDALDATAGAYPYPADLPVLRELAWMFEPYRTFRNSGAIDRKQQSEYVRVVTDVELRILAHVAGKGQSIPLDTRYERIGGGAGWAMIREQGAQGRTGAFGDGIRAYVAVRERGDGRWTYTVGRMSPFVPFDVPAILAALDRAEGSTGSDRWGGGNTIGGSPRVSGSALTPAEVTKIIDAIAPRA